MPLLISFPVRTRKNYYTVRTILVIFVSRSSNGGENPFGKKSIGTVISVEIRRLAMDLYATLYRFYSSERYHEHNYGPTTLIKRLPERRTFNGSFNFYRVLLRDIMGCGIFYIFQRASVKRPF